MEGEHNKQPTPHRSHPQQPDVELRDEEPGVESVRHVESLEEFEKLRSLSAVSEENVATGLQFGDGNSTTKHLVVKSLHKIFPLESQLFRFLLIAENFCGVKRTRPVLTGQYFTRGEPAHRTPLTELSTHTQSLSGH